MSIYNMNTEQSIKFVELYKSNNCLWDFNLPEYKDRNARDRALRYIADQMQIDGFGPKEVAQKIKIIRTTYKQTLNKIVKSSLYPVAVYKPKLPWFECADSFLNSHFSGSTSNLHDKLQTKAERFNSSASSQGEEEAAEVHQPQLRNSVHDPLFQGNSEQKANLRSVETEFDLWARSLALQLNDMSVCRALKLQLQIQTLVTNERLEYESSEESLNLHGISNTKVENPSSSTHPRMPSPTFAMESIEIKLSPVLLDDEDTS